MEHETRELLERFKSTMNVAGEMARQGLDIAGKKTGEALESAKTLWKLSELQSKINQLYREAGQFAYLAYTDGGNNSEEHLHQLFEQLDTKLAEAATIQRQRKSCCGEHICPNTDCTAVVQDDDVFCRKCGTPLSATP